MTDHERIDSGRGRPTPRPDWLTTRPRGGIRALSLLVTLGFASLSAGPGEPRPAPPPRQSHRRAVRDMAGAADSAAPQDLPDVFADVDPRFVIDDESGRYEGWMIRELAGAHGASPRADGTSA